MAPPGGAAAIYGFLYQILRTAEWALKLDLSAPDNDVFNVTIVAEPEGGDVDIRFPSKRLVQQFKVRDDGTWSLADIVEKVLPDLYRAIGDEKKDVSYQFVTSGSMGKWAAAYAFFRNLQTRSLATLDATDERFVLRDKLYSERSLFNEIRRRLREQRPARDEDEATTTRKLWHLLARFEFKTTTDLADAERSVRHLVSTYVPDDALLDDKVARLRDVVLSYAASGNRTFTPRELLTDAGINSAPFTRLGVARSVARDVTLGDMRRFLGYDRALSVRPLPAPFQTNRVFVFSGESGQGKSWCLADYAYALMESDEGGLVAFAPASGDLEKDLTTAAQRIVRGVLGYNTSAPFEQLVEHVRKTVPNLSDPWLTICLDDVSYSVEIMALSQARLDDWQINVVVTAGPRLARHEALKCQSEAVSDFSQRELRDFLSRHGRSWPAIPPEVRQTMRRPLLAAIFVREAEEWSPNVEYELYDACWRRLSTAREQPDHPADVTAILALAADFAAGGKYPWSSRRLRELDIDGEQQIRLESIGWLRTDEHGSASIWHGRLLNWAVAETVAQNVQENCDDPAKTTTIIARFWNDEQAEGHARPHLNYVGMDVMWICASRRFLSPKQTAAVVKYLGEEHFGDEAAFYRLLATAGSVIVPALAERVRSLSDDDPNAHVVRRNAANAIVLALRTTPRTALDHVVALLSEPLPALRNIGIRAAAALPDAAFAPILWHLLHVHDAETPRLNDGSIEASQRRVSRQRLYNALAGSVSKGRDWLEEKIMSLPAQAHDAVTLAWLLSALEDEAGRKLWLRVKSKLFASTPPEDPGGLIACIRNYADGEEIERLKPWLKSQSGFVMPSALGALAIVAPDDALNAVRSHDSATVSNFSSWWFPWLMLTRREETLAAAREQLVSDPSVANWFRGNEHELDTETTDALLEHLSGRLRTFLENIHAPEQYVGDAAHILRMASHTLPVDRLRAQNGGNFEHEVVAAITRMPLEEAQNMPAASDDLRVLLRRISEDSAIEALSTALSSEGVTTVEVDLSVAYPVPKVAVALRALLRTQAESWDQEHIPEMAVHVTRALALIGDGDGVIDAVWSFGPNVVDNDVPELIGDQELMNDELIHRLRASLSSADDMERMRAVECLRLSRRPEFISEILNQAALPDASIGMRFHSLRAARDLVERGQELPEVVRDIVGGDCIEVRDVLAELLVASGTPASMDLLAQLARKLPFNHVGDKAIVAELVDGTERGREMAELLRSHLWPFPHRAMFNDDGRIWVRLFPVIADDDLRQKALDAALIDDPSIDSIAVIECVATFDMDAAFDLVASALKSDRQGREILTRYLMRFGANRAASTLLHHLPEERVGVVRWAICRVVRWLADDAVTTQIREMASDESSAVREAAYDCGGWSPHVFAFEELRSVALSDVSVTVRTAARDALRRRVRLDQTAALLQRLVEAKGSEAWLYAEAATTNGDPYLLTSDRDQLSLWPVLKRFPPALHRQAQLWLDRRRKSVDRQADTEDFLRGRREG